MEALENELSKRMRDFKYHGISFGEFAITLDEIAKKILEKDHVDAYNGQWRRVSIEELAGYCLKHIRALKDNSVLLTIPDGEDKATDIALYGIFLFLKYRELRGKRERMGGIPR